MKNYSSLKDGYVCVYFLFLSDSFYRLQMSLGSVSSTALSPDDLYMDEPSGVPATLQTGQLSKTCQKVLDKTSKGNRESVNTVVGWKYRGNSSEQLHVSHDLETSFSKLDEVESQDTFIPQNLVENKATKQLGKKSPTRRKKAFGSRATWSPHSLRNRLHQGHSDNDGK